MLKNNVGLKIKKLRGLAGVSQNKLATDSKITPAYLCELERGSKNNPSYDVLARIATALGVSVADLISEPSEEPKEVPKAVNQ